MNEVKRDPMAQARKRLILDRPWYGTLSLRLNVVEDETIPTACTNGIDLHYNRTWFESLSPKQQEGVCAHEVYHCALEHPFRIGNRELELANVAADHVANLDLIADGIELPQPFLADPRFKGLAFEKVYSLLYEERQKQRGSDEQKRTDNQNTDTMEGSGRDTQSGKPSSETSGKSSKGTGKTSPETLSGGARGEASEKAPGEGTGDSTKTPYKQTSQGKSGESTPIIGNGPGSPGDAANFGGIEAPPPDYREPDTGEPVKVEDIAREWEKAVETATLVCSKAGTMPGFIKETIKASRELKDDLTEALQQYLLVKSDYSYATPDRRFIGSGLILPGTFKSNLQNVVIAIDTSGSVNTKMLEVFATKCNEVLAMDAKPQRILIIQCDTAVRKVEEVDEVGFNLEVVGRGGTYFNPVFDYLRENEITPDVLIYLTDLYNGDRLLQEPEYPVLWVAPIQSMKPSMPYGEIVRVDAHA